MALRVLHVVVSRHDTCLYETIRFDFSPRPFLSSSTFLSFFLVRDKLLCGMRPKVKKSPHISESSRSWQSSCKGKVQGSPPTAVVLCAGPPCTPPSCCLSFTLQELAVLKQCSHPFIVSLSPGGQFQTSRHLHLVLNYCPGGDLFSLLARVGRLPEQQVR